MTAYASMASGDWTAGIWDEAGFPGSGDTVTIAAGHTVDLNAPSICDSLAIAATGALTDTGGLNGIHVYGAAVVDGTWTLGTALYECDGNISGSGTLTVGAGSLSASGTITLDNMTVTTGAATITGDVNLGDVGGVGTLTMSDTLTINGGFLLDGGELTMATNKMSVSGSWINTSGTMVTPGELEMTGTGNLQSGTSNTPDTLELTSTAVVTLTGASRITNGLTVVSGAALNLSDKTLRVYNTGTADTDVLSIAAGAVITGTTGLIECYFGRTINNSTPVCIDSELLLIQSITSQTWNQSGRIDCGDLKVYSASVGQVATLNITGNLTATGDLIIGIPGAADRSGIVNLNSGTHAIAAVVDGDAANLANALALGSCTLECSVAFNADNITVSADAALAPRLIFIAGGELSNIDDKGLDNPIAVWGDASVLGAGTTDNDVDTYGPNYQTYPGSMLTMGVGGGHGAVSF